MTPLIYTLLNFIDVKQPQTKYKVDCGKANIEIANLSNVATQVSFTAILQANMTTHNHIIHIMIILLDFWMNLIIFVQIKNAFINNLLFSQATFVLRIQFVLIHIFINKKRINYPILQNLIILVKPCSRFQVDFIVEQKFILYCLKQVAKR